MPDRHTGTAVAKFHDERDNLAADREECFVDVGAAFMVDEQSFHPVEPGEGALDDRAVAAQAGAVPGLAARDDRFDPELQELMAVRVGVVAAVRVSGRRRGRPRRPATADTRSSSGSNWVTSWRLPPVLSHDQ